MTHYRRVKVTGSTYFFTVLAYQRKPILCDRPILDALHKAVKDVQRKLPFTVGAWVVMPDHLHCIWTLPEGDADYSKRWRLIKWAVSRACSKHYKHDRRITASKKNHRESTIWQRRFWEHQIRDQRDFDCHMDYIHFNPVKHGFCDQPNQWQWSTIHRHIKAGHYPEDWREPLQLPPDDTYFGE